jgi:4-amino-4-deoxy-L-arabinose transferase-like glycosyltransferase
VVTNLPDEAQPTPLSPIARFAWAALILATLYVCYFSHLGTLGLVGPDEPRYAWIARDMAESGDWVTPRLYGKPWFEKPPLYYWAAALSFKLFGVSEAAARLPSAISALLATLAIAWLALRLYGPESARWLLLLLPTTVGMIGFSHAAATDMPFSAMLTIAMVYAAVLLRLVPQLASSSAYESAGTTSPTRPSLSLTSFISSTSFTSLLFGFFLGLAVLAKGPAALILSGGSVFFWALFTKRWRDAFRLFHPVGIASFCLTALPWYILCARRNPDFLRTFIIEHNFKRYLTPEFQHIQPFWFYAPILLLALLPWTCLLGPLSMDLYRQWSRRTLLQAPSLLFLSMIAFTLAFFSVSKSKLPGYALPALPPLGLLLSQSLSAGITNRRRWLSAFSGLTLAALAVIVLVNIEKIPFAVDYFPPGPLGIVLPAIITLGIISSILSVLRRVAAAMALCTVTILGTVLFSLTGDAGWSLDKGISKATAAYYAMDVLKHSDVKSVSTYNLKRADNFALSFYFHREIPEWSGNESQRGWILTNYRGGQLFRKLGLACLPERPRDPITICGNPDLVKGIARSRQL